VVPVPPPSRRPSLVLIAVLAAALGTGAAASALAGVASAPTWTGPSPAALEVAGEIVLYAILALVVGGAAYLLYRRLAGGAIPIPNEFAVVALVCILLMVLFIVAARTFLGGSPLPTNTTSGSGPTQNQTGTGNVTVNKTNGTGAAAPPLGVHFPPWIGFLAVAAIAIVAVVVVGPGLRAVVAARGKHPDLGDAARTAAGAARQALAGAADALGEGQDPRAVIIALYAELLRRIVPMVGSVDPDTQEEIRAQHLVRLGISPRRSESLTRLFEEARYSTHPLGPEAAERATEVIRSAEADLARVAAPA
jgi:uncharacterized membrane protein